MRKIIAFFFLLLILIIGIYLYRVTHAEIVKTDSVLSVSLPKTNSIKHVFVIVMENTNWSTLKDNRSAPYINSLLKQKNVSYASNYHAINHPSEPNYIWMEAGDAKYLPNGDGTIDLTSDGDPTAINSTDTPDHLVSLLEKKQHNWKAYVEGIDGTDCPLSSTEDSHFAARHVPMLYFNDITNNESKCIEHIRPFSELASDVAENRVPAYSFIVPNLCHDMHDLFSCESLNRIATGDTWLSEQLPFIQRSPIFSSSAIFLTWDEGSGVSKSPIGMIVISPFAKGNGYHNAKLYTHSSLVRTIQDIFSSKPYLRDAANTQSLSDLFSSL